MIGLLRLLARRGNRWTLEDGLPLVDSVLYRILELVDGKHVLDVGCVGGPHGVDIALTSHALIAKRARTCMGIDIVPDEIARWQKEGYNVMVADAEMFQVGRSFDVVVAADVIEHLSNPGRFIERAWEHLHPEGLLCITTPNALSLNNAVKGLAGLHVQVNPEHTCWFDRWTLRQLLSRYGFDVVEEYWQDYQAHPLAALLLRLRRNLASHLIVIAKKRTRTAGS